MFSELQKANLLLCPNCLKEIPKIIFTITNDKLIFKVYCNCFSKESERNLYDYETLIKSLTNIKCNLKNCIDHKQKGEKWCLECEADLCVNCLKNHSQHYLIDYHIDSIICSSHKKIFSHYCLVCKCNYCEDCNQHLNYHSAIQIEQINLSSLEKKTLFIQDTIDNNEKIKDSFLKALENYTLNKYAPSEIIKWKNMIEEDYKKNHMINLQLKEYYDLLLATIKILKIFPNQILINHILSIRINKPIIYNINDELEKAFKYLKQHFMRQYVITQLKNNEKIDYQDNIISQIETLLGHSWDVYCIIELTNSQLASGSFDKTIRVWNLDTFTSENVLHGHTGFIRCLLQLDNNILVSGSNDSSIKFWDLTTSKCIQTLLGHNNSVNSILQLTNRIISCSSDMSIKYWSLETYNCIQTINGHICSIVSLIMIHNNLLVSGSTDESIKVWEADTYLNVTIIRKLPHHVIYMCNLQNRRFGFTLRNNSINIYDSVTFKCVIVFQGHAMCSRYLIQLKDGQIATGSDDQSIKLWNNTTFNCNAILLGHSSIVWGIIELRNGMLVSTSEDQTIKLWKIN